MLPLSQLPHDLGYPHLIEATDLALVKNSSGKTIYAELTFTAIMFGPAGLEERFRQIESVAITGRRKLE